MKLIEIEEIENGGMQRGANLSRTRECGDYNNSVCYFCLTTHFCTKRNNLTGEISQIMKTPYTPAHRVGGNIQVIEFD